MLIIDLFRAEDVFNMALQPGQAYVRDYATIEGLRTLEDTQCYTLKRGDIPIFCGGLVERWAGTMIAWSVFSSEITKAEFLQVFRKTKAFLHNTLKGGMAKRIEMYAEIDFKQPHRWAEMLGMKKEIGIMRRFQQDGKDCALYSIILEDISHGD